MKRTILILVFGGMIIAALTPFFLPPDYFDYGESICPSKLLFDTECPGCGTTRATMRLYHFRFAEAWEFNKLSFITVPFIGFMYIRLLYKLFKRIRDAKN